MYFKRSYCLILSIALLFSLFSSSANANYDAAFTREAADLCLDIGRKGNLFPEDTTYEDLIVETYMIEALGEPYTVWVVSTEQQREGVEFGWISIHAPTNTILQSSHTRGSYEDAVNLLTWEQAYGCNYFWPAALKAQYYHALRGNESRITYPTENEITEAEAIIIARQTMLNHVGLNESAINQLLISAEFYQDSDPLDSVQSERFWGITFRENSMDGSFQFTPLYAVVIDGVSGLPEYALDYRKELQIDIPNE